MWKILLTLLFNVPQMPSTHARIAMWKEECPSGYVRVPKNSAYVANDFCVMKWEAKARNTSTGAIDADGCNEGGCTTANWGLAANAPYSTATGKPWRRISAVNAQAECRSLGTQYDLISNAEWQTIVRNIELVPSNWKGGAVGSGCIYTGNSGETNCGYDFTTIDGGTSRNSRARLYLSSGQEIWDLSANVAELILEASSSYGADDGTVVITDATHTTTGLLADEVARNAKGQFGPAGTSYSGCYNSTDGWCGMGSLFISSGGTAIVRGTNYGDATDAGIFSAYTGGDAYETGWELGFRCVYHLTDPCDSNPPIGTICKDGTLFAGNFQGSSYRVTPSGCTNSSTPTCAGGNDSVTKTYKGSSGTYTNITGVTDVGSTTALSPLNQKGDVITPIIANDASVSSDSAADYCNDMVYGGKDDWALPAKNEMAYLYCIASSTSHNASYPQAVPDCYMYGGKRNKITGFDQVTPYWSSSEGDAGGAWGQGFSDGWIYNHGKDQADYVRCMRRVPSSDPCAGTPAVGSVCAGGALYAGIFEGAKYMVTPGGCNNSSTPACSGSTDTVTKAWRGSSGSNVDIGVTNSTGDADPAPQRGYITTPIIIAAASVSSDSAADYCANMVYGGYSDWYLPDKTELGYIYCKSDAGSSHSSLNPEDAPNCTPYGGKTSELTGFANADYWSSTEFASNSAQKTAFSTGDTGSLAKSTASRVRCVRRYDPMEEQSVVLNSGTSWNVPAGVTSLKSVEVWGAGGGAASYSGGSKGGGGGGAYSKITNFAVVPGFSISLSIGTGGISNTSGSAGGAGGDTWFDSTSTVLAKGGSGAAGGGSNFNGGAGGAAASGVGTTKYSGGTGGNAVNGWGGGGGGAAASPGGDGGNGANSPSSPENGGAGGVSPSAGSAGSAGTGAATPTAGGAGGDNEDGGGGGGGGGADSNHSQAGGKGGRGGVPGGGGGSSGSNSTGTLADPGANGQIRIKYYSP